VKYFRQLALLPKRERINLSVLVHYKHSRLFDGSAKENNLSAIVPDFQKITSKQIVAAI